MSLPEPTVEQGQVLENLYAGVPIATNFDDPADAARAASDCVAHGWVLLGRLTQSGRAWIGKPRKTNRFEIRIVQETEPSK